jgi:hypothetical protein
MEGITATAIRMTGDKKIHAHSLLVQAELVNMLVLK